MLGKLLKYEWKSSGKITLLLNAYIILITLCGVIMLKTRMFSTITEGKAASQKEYSVMILIGTLLFIAYIVSIIGVAVAVVLFQIFRFYKNYYTDEGYLMHTLPVSSAQLILSKGLFAFGAILVTSAVLMVSSFSITLTAAPAADRQNMIYSLQMFIPSSAREFGWPPALLVLYLIVLTVISAAHSILAFYAALSIGQRFAKHKIIGAIIAYAVMNMAEQIFSVIFLLLRGWSTLMADQSATGAVLFVQSMLRTSLFITLIITLIYWFITNYMMKKRLNLE